LTSGPDLGHGPTVGSPWWNGSSMPPSLGRGQVAPSPPPGIPGCLKFFKNFVKL